LPLHFLAALTPALKANGLIWWAPIGLTLKRNTATYALSFKTPLARRKCGPPLN
jgi:hypothetical protein